MKVAVLVPVSWSTPPKGYDTWELFSSILTEGLLQNFLQSFHLTQAIISFSEMARFSKILTYGEVYIFQIAWNMRMSLIFQPSRGNYLLYEISIDKIAERGYSKNLQKSIW